MKSVFGIPVAWFLVSGLVMSDFAFSKEPEYYLREIHENMTSDLPSYSDPTAMLVDKGVGALLGGAVGDAVGVALEFSSRPYFPEQVVMDMVGNSSIYVSDPEREGVRGGEWTDDTAMALAMGESLLNNGYFNKSHVLSHWYSWMDEGYLNPRNFRKDRKAENFETSTFDIGSTTRNSLCYYKQNESDPEVIPGAVFWKEGRKCKPSNGSIMRLAPIPVFFHDFNLFGKPVYLIEMAGLQSDLTHGNTASGDAARVMAYMIGLAMSGASKEDVLAAKGFDFSIFDLKNPSSLNIKSLFEEAHWRNKKRSELSPPSWDYSGGSAEFTLECALWSISKSDNFKDAILLAINLGLDADTVGSVTGQLAGALYGLQGIPAEWRSQVVEGPRIEEMAKKLIQAGGDFYRRKGTSTEAPKVANRGLRFSVFPRR